MKLRSVTTWLLLAFVVLAVAAIVVKNVHRSRQERLVSAQLSRREAVIPPNADPTETPAPTPGESAPPVVATSVAAPTAPAAAATPRLQPRTAVPRPRPTAPRRVVRVTYFHTTTRCLSCYKIEALSEAAVSANFAAALANGDLIWRTVNIDEPGNGHYVDDYKLYTKSVIVSEFVGDQEVRFKNLDRVWKLLGDEQAFARYVTDEVAAFLESS